MQRNEKHKFQLLPIADIKRLVFVCGKFYYELYHMRSRKKVRDVALIRIEQVAPFPHD